MAETKKSGASADSRTLPTGGGGVRDTGDSFRPNLAMGGGTYRVPIEVPQGPGGFGPKIDLLYSTSYGLGVFGLGWLPTFPFVEARRASVLRPDLAETERYSLFGTEDLIDLGDGGFLPQMSEGYQRFERMGDGWRSTSPNLVEMRFGTESGARVSGEVDGVQRTWRWYLDTIVFPGDREVRITYDQHLGTAYPLSVRWSVYTLAFAYEARPDPWSSFRPGFEVRTERRCRRIELDDARLPGRPLRRWDLAYEEAPLTGHSLLAAVQLTGFDLAGAPTAQPPLRLAYTAFDPAGIAIRQLTPLVTPPPGLDPDVTLFDHRGTALPGILRLAGHSAEFWENRGEGRWGPPERLPHIPQGVSLSDEDVHLADMTGSGTADLVVGGRGGAGYYPNEPRIGFGRKRPLPLEPSLSLAAGARRLIDLDDDGVLDLFTVQNGRPLGVLNDGGQRWLRPLELRIDGALPAPLGDERWRLADMNGDGRRDFAFIHQDRVEIWPNLGNGHWGAARALGIPQGLEPAPETRERTFLVDLIGNGCADLIEIGARQIRVWINRTGEGFAEPIVIGRTPRLGAARLLVADILGNGVSAVVWSQEHGNRHGYWSLAAVGHQKPYLLGSIDSGRGLVTTIRYSTSTAERTRDRDAGRDWDTYLPFPVHVVSEIATADTVRGTTEVRQFQYHDGHYDARARRWSGFGRVDTRQPAEARQAGLLRIDWFHNQPEQTPWGRGQPYRSEHRDLASGELLRLEQAAWIGIEHAGVSESAYVVARQSFATSLCHGGAIVTTDRSDWEHDAVGNETLETRVGTWLGLDGAARTDVRITESVYAANPVPTSFLVERAVTDGGGRLVEFERRFYDGEPLVGLPLGQVQRGEETRVQRAVLAGSHLNEVYGGALPPWADFGYEEIVHPVHGLLRLIDKERFRRDAGGNITGRMDALGGEVVVSYDADGLFPTRFTHPSGSVQTVEYDRAAGQIRRSVDYNGHESGTVFDGLGDIVEVYLPGAQAGRATETYERDRFVVPNRVIKRIRLEHGDGAPSWIQHEYLDGHQDGFQLRTRTERGDWAVGRQRRLNARGARDVDYDGWFSASPAFDATVPAGTAFTETFHDALGRITEQRFPNGGRTLTVHEGAIERFYSATAAAALATNPATEPTRITVRDAWSRVVEIREPGTPAPMRHRYDVKDRLITTTDALGHILLAIVYDLEGRPIRRTSADAGATTILRDGLGNEVLTTDARGLSVFRRYDAFGRLAEVRDDGPAGPIQETHSYDIGPGTNLVGRLARVEGPFGTVSYSYAPMGRRTEISRTFPGLAQALTVRYRYNTQDKITRVEYPDGRLIDYTYNGAGLLAGIAGVTDAIEYDAAGKRTAIHYTAGVTTEIQRQAGLEFVERIETFNRNSGERYQHLVHHYDLSGQVTAIDDLSTVAGKLRNNQTFSYNDRHQLVGATGRGSDGNYAFAYEYDPLGNLVRNDESFSEPLRYGHQEGDPAHPNRLVRRAGAAAAEWLYDAAGNLVQSPEQGTLTYDRRGRLIRLERGNTTIEMTYDHEDGRVILRTRTTTRDITEYNIEGLYRQRSDGTSLSLVWDEDRKAAEIDESGAGHLFHTDRVGNNNVFSNLQTGAFAGHVEYTPYGLQSVTISISPHYGFQQACSSPALGLVHLRTRYYNPTTGRFLTPDRYLLEHPDEAGVLVLAWNFYLYSACNPVNFVDPTGRFIWFLIGAALIIGAIAGLVGAAVNGAETWDEWLLSVVAGMVGAVVITLIGFWIGGPVLAAVFLGIFSFFSIVGTPITRALDETDSPVAWFFSFLIKWVQSPVLTTLGLLVVAGFAIGGADVDLRRGTLFVNVGGTGRSALTLGAIAYTQGGHFDADGNVADDLARHEAYHTRQVTAFGEWGFYLTYITVGVIWGAAEAGEPFGTDNAGCGNPFEKTARTFNHAAPATPTGSC